MKFFLYILGMLFTFAFYAMEKEPRLYPCKIVPVTIHADFYPHLRACLKKNKSVNDVYCGDFPFHKNACTVQIVTKNMIQPDKNMDRFHRVISGDKIGKNARRKLKNIIAAYKKLSEYRMNQHIYCERTGTVSMLSGWRTVFCPDIMEYFYNLHHDLPKICAIARLEFVDSNQTA